FRHSLYSTEWINKINNDTALLRPVSETTTLSIYLSCVKDKFLPTKHWPCSCLERIHRHRLLSQNSGNRHLSSQGASIVSGTENQELNTATVNETKIEMHTLDTLAKTGLRVVFQHIISVVTLTLSKHTGYAEAGAICVRVTRFAHRTRTLEAERNKEKTVEIHNYRENKENLPWQGAKNAQLSSTADASKTSKTNEITRLATSTKPAVVVLTKTSPTACLLCGTRMEAKKNKESNKTVAQHVLKTVHSKEKGSPTQCSHLSTGKKTAPEARNWSTGLQRLDVRHRVFHTYTTTSI
ncbi:hypothetical protein Tsp_13459, partial [Trichinella spiralis]|uniref:hypothetical protein n=1 Tax=Trichinella spiralis TaxID=6334 RepID=UPI0001EFEB7F